MDNDLEYLKEIKEAQDKAENDVRSLAADQEKQLSELRARLDEELKQKTDEYQEMYNEAMKKAAKDAAEQAQLIMEDARKKAGSMKLDLDHDTARKILIEEIQKYLEG